jgi:hypothetical protein
LLTILAAAVSFFMADVGTVFRFLILIGNGPGLVLLLRWFWWRINAWAEIAAMAAGLGLALLTSLPPLEGLTFGLKLGITAFGSMAIWIPAMLLTRAEAPATLEAFYRRIRPAGWWGPQRAATGLAPLDDPIRDARRWLVWVAGILGAMLGIGWLAIGRW